MKERPGIVEDVKCVLDIGLKALRDWRLLLNIRTYTHFATLEPAWISLTVDGFGTSLKFSPLFVSTLLSIVS